MRLVLSPACGPCNNVRCLHSFLILHRPVQTI
jgi:hypothetical protein